MGVQYKDQYNSEINLSEYNVDCSVYSQRDHSIAILSITFRIKMRVINIKISKTEFEKKKKKGRIKSSDVVKSIVIKCMQNYNNSTIILVVQNDMGMTDSYPFSFYHSWFYINLFMSLSSSYNNFTFKFIYLCFSPVLTIILLLHISIYVSLQFLQ